MSNKNNPPLGGFFAMYEKETKNINLLLKNIQVPSIVNWWVSDLRDMEWEGEIRLNLNVVIDSSFYEKKYVREWNATFDTSRYEYDMKQKIIGIFKHYVRSFLNLKIGDVKTVQLISYKIEGPTSYHSNYSINGLQNDMYVSYDEYDWFG